MTDKYKLYMFDLGLLIKDRAVEACRARDKFPYGSSEGQFDAGRVLAFNEVISIMQQQAEGFGIPLSELQLDDIDPDRELT